MTLRRGEPGLAQLHWLLARRVRFRGDGGQRHALRRWPTTHRGAGQGQAQGLLVPPLSLVGFELDGAVYELVQADWSCA